MRTQRTVIFQSPVRNQSPCARKLRLLRHPPPPLAVQSTPVSPSGARVNGTTEETPQPTSRAVVPSQQPVEPRSQTLRNQILRIQSERDSASTPAHQATRSGAPPARSNPWARPRASPPTPPIQPPPSPSHTPRQTFTPASTKQTVPASATTLLQSVQLDRAVNGCSQSSECKAHVVIRAKQMPYETDEQTCFASLRSMQAESILSHHWILPADIEQMSWRDLRKQWSKHGVTTSLHDNGFRKEVIGHLLAGTQHVYETVSPDLLMPPTQLEKLIKAIHQSGVPYKQLFQQPVTIHKETSGVLIYSWKLLGMPGQEKHARHCARTGEYPVSFMHFTSPEGLLGILRSGFIFPSTRETIGATAGSPPLGFFSRGSTQHDALVLDQICQFIASNCDYGKAEFGLCFTGYMHTEHHKPGNSDTQKEQRLMYSYNCVKPPSKDKRWCFRTDDAVIYNFHLVYDSAWDSWGDWKAQRESIRDQASKQLQSSASQGG